MGSGIVGVVAQGALTNLHAREAKERLLQRGDIFFLELAQEHLRRVTRIAAVLLAVLDIGNAAVEFLAVYCQGATESGGIELLAHLAHNHRYLVDRLIEDQQLAVAVVD